MITQYQIQMMYKQRKYNSAYFAFSHFSATKVSTCAMELSSEQSQHKHEKDVLLIEQEEPSKENVDDISQIESTHR